MSDEARVEARGLTKVFFDVQRGEIRAADGVTFECRAGEVFGLLGPNGAGKTTTLRLISTVIAPTAGTAVVCGHDVREEPEAARRRLGFHSTTTGLYPRLSPLETLVYFGELFGMARDEAEGRATALAERFEFVGYANAPCGKLSSGMQQRVSIARAMVHDPDVLIFDEPTAALDPLVARHTRDVLRECADAGKCVVCSTHSMSEAEAICDRMAIITDGRVPAIGSLEELKGITGATTLEEAFVRLASGDGEGPE